MNNRASCDRLFCLTLGWEHSPEAISIEGGADDVVLRLPVIGIVVHSPGGWLLLETGLNTEFCRNDPDAARIYAYGLPEFDTNSDPLLDGLAACGLHLQDLAAAAVSHLHVDHAGGLRHLAGRVPVYVQAAELAFALGRASLAEAYVRGDYVLDRIDWRQLDGDATLAPGVDAVFTPGHTPGHMSYRVRMAKSGTWLFAIDAIDLARGIREDRPIGWSADPADAPKRRASHNRLVAVARQEGARLIPGHCSETWLGLRQPPLGYC